VRLQRVIALTAIAVAIIAFCAPASTGRFEPAAASASALSSMAENTVRSPNGKYSISVTNSGIVLSGPLVSVTLSGGTVGVHGISINIGGTRNAQLNIDSVGALNVQSSGPAAISGATLSLNGCSEPVAEQGDAVLISPITVPFGGGSFQPTGTITQGSATVCTG
jgi:hypothetical protein